VDHPAGTLHGSGAAETPPVPVTELLGSLLGLFRVGLWRGDRGGSGSLGSDLLLASVLGELPIFDQQTKTGAASVGLFVCLYNKLVKQHGSDQFHA
jgi:hypothetical protein